MTSHIHPTRSTLIHTAPTHDHDSALLFSFRAKNLLKNRSPIVAMRFPFCAAQNLAKQTLIFRSKTTPFCLNEGHFLNVQCKTQISADKERSVSPATHPYFSSPAASSSPGIARRSRCGPNPNSPTESFHPCAPAPP